MKTRSEILKSIEGKNKVERSELARTHYLDICDETGFDFDNRLVKLSLGADFNLDDYTVNKIMR